jgi:hypothetical protein
MATTALDGTNGIIRNFDFQTPVAGFSYTVPAGVCGTVFTPAGTLSTGTITMPATPADGMTVNLSSSQAITTLTLNANTGQSILNPITTLSTGGSAAYLYRLSNTTWYRVH